MEHTTHWDDCGCLSARHAKELADLRAQLAQDERAIAGLVAELDSLRATCNALPSASGPPIDWDSPRTEKEIP